MRLGKMSTAEAAASRKDFGAAASGDNTDISSLALTGKATIGDVLFWLGMGASGPQVTFNGTAGYITFDRASGNCFFYANGANRLVVGLNSIFPGVDNLIALGGSGSRFKDLYLVNNPTVSSDASLKTVRPAADGGPALSTAELAAWARVSPLVWKLNDDPSGLSHVGYIAQSVKAAFAAQGLDITKYALWHQDTLQDGSTRASLVYAECAVFEAAYQRQQVATLTKQLAALLKALGITLPAT